MTLRESDFLKGGGIAYVAGLASVSLALGLSSFGAQGILDIEPSVATAWGFGFFWVCAVLGTCFMMVGMSFFASNSRMLQPRDPNRDQLARVLLDESLGKESLIYGRPGRILREALLSDRPLDRRLLRERWCVLDSNDNDVTDLTFSEVEGVVRLVFD
jgi:hypothetical protein